MNNSNQPNLDVLLIMARETLVKRITRYNEEACTISQYYDIANTYLRDFGVIHAVLNKRPEHSLVISEGANESREIADAILNDTRLEVRKGIKDDYVISLQWGTRNFECWKDMRDYENLELQIVKSAYKYVRHNQKNKIKEKSSNKNSVPTYAFMRRFIRSNISNRNKLSSNIFPPRKNQLVNYISDYFVEVFGNNMFPGEPPLMEPSILDVIEFQNKPVPVKNQYLQQKIVEVFANK